MYWGPEGKSQYEVGTIIAPAIKLHIKIKTNAEPFSLSTLLSPPVKRSRNYKWINTVFHHLKFKLIYTFHMGFEIDHSID